MNQQGYIIEIVDNKTAKLKMQRHSACASCGKCQTLSSESKEILVEVDNSIGAKPGDHVEVNMENMNVLKATALAYAVPLIFLLVGTIVSYFMLDMIISTQGIIVELISGIIGIMLMLLSYVILKKNDSKFRDSRKFIPVITKIIE
ncbi:SoxR reducing system RseC family protein [Romboutsia sp. CE17]|uniref:SoxR reducing system RseC family protein n=1 Tax=Romboutsia sp. CE17 TaxID=2724150 RepID=UPI001442DC78|nr:SoxR reducing system RseC family protein [Romboutsia sp. CE17]QJA09419.1 SoxR reducing system RseC family protein [Romboutsia sp. CE17]